MRYVDGKPVEVEKLLISSQHAEGSESLIREDLWEHVVLPTLPPTIYDAAKLRENFLVNPTGRFVIGGPMGDCGLTGRKIIVDTYGGFARHGGGAFSGKDPSKVDRSAAYAARYVAKNIVAAGLADRAEVQVAYAIGVAHPVSVMIETFGTERIGRGRILELIQEHFDLRPAAFRHYLRLHRPIYQQTAAYGHFGREEPDFTWELTDKAQALRDAAGLDATVEARRALIARVIPLTQTRAIKGLWDYELPLELAEAGVGSLAARAVLRPHDPRCRRGDGCHVRRAPGEARHRCRTAPCSLAG